MKSKQYVCGNPTELFNIFSHCRKFTVRLFGGLSFPIAKVFLKPVEVDTHVMLLLISKRCLIKIFNFISYKKKPNSLIYQIHKYCKNSKAVEDGVISCREVDKLLQSF